MTQPATFPAPNWSEEDAAYAVKVATGRPREKSLASVARDIAVHLGRTNKSVEQKLRFLLMSPEAKERRAVTERARYARRVENYKPKDSHQIAIHRPTREMIEARDVKNAAGIRDLTAALQGDPPVGYSALERRA